MVKFKIDNWPEIIPERTIIIIADHTKMTIQHDIFVLTADHFHCNQVLYKLITKNNFISTLNGAENCL